MNTTNNQKDIELYEYLTTFLTEERIKKFDEIIQHRTEFILPVFEDVYQYRNAAAIVRSAEGLGYNKIIALEQKNEFITEERVARGAHKWIEIEKMDAHITSLIQLKNKGYQIVAVSPENNAQNIQQFQITQPAAIVFGTEFRGITQETKEIADAFVQIPMVGFTESFNVSVAAAICFYELRQKLEQSTFDWKLNEYEQLKTKIKWAMNAIKSSEKIVHRFYVEKN